MAKKDQPTPMMDESNYATSSDSVLITRRTAYAVETLISEVEAVFPGVDYTLTNRNGRGVALGVTFFGSEETVSDLGNLLLLMNDPAYSEDHRIEEVTEDAEGVHVLFFNRSLLQDSRESFGLAGAWAVLTGEQ